MNILYENDNIAICEKPTDIVSQSMPDGCGFSDMAAAKFGYAAIINRLDTQVGGAVVFAKNSQFASILSSLSSNQKISKTYLAIVEGEPKEDRGVFEDLLFKDSSKNKSFVVKRERKGVKKAKLEYEVISKANHNGKTLTLLAVKLHTGRTHQIRVQFSSRKMPLCGDGKYGSKDNGCKVALWSHHISFEIGEDKVFATSMPPFDKYPWNLFNMDAYNR